ncbi:hypothetical protein MLD38_035250 [Melastoma candidum]|nr:hypothetical protein MLD38_035250 [Melastoma candidum]
MERCPPECEVLCRSLVLLIQRDGRTGYVGAVEVENPIQDTGLYGVGPPVTTPPLPGPVLPASEPDSPTSDVSPDSPGTPKLENSDSFCSPRVKLEGRTIYYKVADKDGESEEGMSFLFKGSQLEKLVERLEDETGLEDLVVCSHWKGKLYPLRLQLPPNNAAMHIVVLPSSSEAVKDLEVPLTIRAKTVAANLKVLVMEKGMPLSKVKVSGGCRCNVTNGHFPDNMVRHFAENYPMGHTEFRGSFFRKHGSMDTMAWFHERGVGLKTDDDGRVFPVSDSSSSIIDCLMSEAKGRGVLMQTGKTVTAASVDASGNFLINVERRTANVVEKIEANYLLIATGSSKQGYILANQLGHSLIDPVPSLFTFKIADPQLVELAGVTFPKVCVKLKLGNVQRNIPELTQVGPTLVTHWGLSGPVILRLSAWGARYLFSAGYEGKGSIVVDFLPDVHLEEVKSILSRQKLPIGVEISLNTMESKLQPRLFFAGK